MKGCRACGWYTTTVVATKVSTRLYYCILCDPKGTREANAAKGEAAEAEYRAAL